jgi:hypothetical protein
MELVATRPTRLVGPPRPPLAPFRTNSNKVRKPLKATGVGRAKPLGIVSPEPAFHELRPEKGRIADDELRFWPRSLRTFEGQNGVAALDGIKGAKDRTATNVKAVPAHPWNLSDPDGDTRQFGRIGVDFDAFETFRAHGRAGAPEPHSFGIKIDAVPDILQREERQIDEVSRSARRMEDADTGKSIDEAGIETLRLAPCAFFLAARYHVKCPRLSLRRRPAIPGLVRFGRFGGDPGPDLCPFGKQWANNDRVDDLHDLVAVGVCAPSWSRLSG